MNARSLVAVSMALLPVGPAAAAGIEDVPGDVVAVVEVTAPAERLDTVAATTAWDGLYDLLASLGRSDPSKGTPVRLASLLAAWPEDAVLRDRLRALAGERLMVAALPVPGPHRVAWAVAMEGEGGDASVVALEGLAPALGLEAQPVANGWVALIGDSGLPRALGRQAGSWTVVGPPGSAPVVERLARQLGGGGVSSRLGEAPDFAAAMARIPEDTHVRGFVRPSSLLSEPIAGMPAQPLLRALLADLDAVGFGRNLGSDRLEAWVAARVPATANGPLAGLVRNLTPVGSPLSDLLPDGTLLAWDLGVAPTVAAEVVGRVLEVALPALHSRLVTLAAELEDGTGVDLEADLLRRLRPGLAVGLLPPDPGDRWRRPRPVVMAAVAAGQEVMAPLTGCARWLAGAVADLTEGLLSAAVTRDVVSGVETTGLVLEGLVRVPWPSPTVAVVDGVLLLSPSPSAVGEAIGTVTRRQGPAGAHSRDLRVVERLQADLGGLLRAGAGVLWAVGNAAPRAQHAAEALHLAGGVERVADGLGDLRTQARVEHDGDDTWLLGRAKLELR